MSRCIIRKIRTGDEFEVASIGRLLIGPAIIDIPFDPDYPDRNKAICSNGRRMKYKILSPDGESVCTFLAYVKLAGFEFPVGGICNQKVELYIASDVQPCQPSAK
jgi:hypothetical protein